MSVRKELQNQHSELVPKLMELFHKDWTQVEQAETVLVQIGIIACVKFCHSWETIRWASQQRHWVYHFHEIEVSSKKPIFRNEAPRIILTSYSSMNDRSTPRVWSQNQPRTFPSYSICDHYGWNYLGKGCSKIKKTLIRDVLKQMIGEK